MIGRIWLGVEVGVEIGIGEMCIGVEVVVGIDGMKEIVRGEEMIGKKLKIVMVVRRRRLVIGRIGKKVRRRS